MTTAEKIQIKNNWLITKHWTSVNDIESDKKLDENCMKNEALYIRSINDGIAGFFSFKPGLIVMFENGHFYLSIGNDGYHGDRLDDMVEILWQRYAKNEVGGERDYRENFMYQLDELIQIGATPQMLHAITCMAMDEITNDLIKHNASLSLVSNVIENLWKTNPKWNMEDLSIAVAQHLKNK